MLMKTTALVFLAWPGNAFQHNSHHIKFLGRRASSHVSQLGSKPDQPPKQGLASKKISRSKKKGSKGESWLDKEERLATEAYGKFLEKKAAKKELRKNQPTKRKRLGREKYPGKSGGGSRQQDVLDRDRNDRNSNSISGAGGGAAGGVAPWERDEHDDAGDDADGKLLRHARSAFSVGEVKGFGFVGGYSFEDLPSLGLPEVAFLGRSNVGKSSCLNSLAGPGQRPALVSKMPGRTQRINLFRCGDRQGDFMCFADLPGYGFAKLSKHAQAGIEVFLQQYLEGRKELGLVVLLVDSRLSAQASDVEVLNAFRALGLPHLVVATKVDKLSKKGEEVERSMAVLRQGLGLSDDEGPLPFSAANGAGRKELWGVLRDAVLAMQGFAVDENGRVVPAEKMLVATSLLGAAADQGEVDGFAESIRPVDGKDAEEFGDVFDDEEDEGELDDGEGREFDNFFAIEEGDDGDDESVLDESSLLPPPWEVSGSS